LRHADSGLTAILMDRDAIRQGDVHAHVGRQNAQFAENARKWRHPIKGKR
jgi:hypothetical protein